MLDKILAVLGGGNIALEVLALTAELIHLFESIIGFGRMRGHNDIVPRFAKLFGYAEAYAAACTGNNCNFFSHNITSLFFQAF